MQTTSTKPTKRPNPYAEEQPLSKMTRPTPDEQPDGQPADKAGGQPADKPDDTPDDQPDDTPDDQPDDQPDDTPDDKADNMAAVVQVQATAAATAAEEEASPVRHAALDYRKLRELVQACGKASIVGGFTEDERAGYEARSPADQKALVKDKYDEKVGRACAYFDNYVFGVKGRDVTYVHEDFDAEGTARVVRTYTSRAALVENWAVFAFENDAVSTSRLYIAKVWLDWEHRRIYDGEAFCPDHQEPKPYAPGQKNMRNRWTGWAFARELGFVGDEERMQVITTHLQEVICSGDAELYTYMLKYMKLVLQGRKTGVALCLHGEQGVGKSAFVEYFGSKIVGDRYYAYVEGLNGLLSKFSSHRCYKCWVVCDEIKCRPSPGQAQRLKSMVTQSRTTLEAKNKDAVNVDDYANFCLVSNSRDAAPVDGKADRRYCAISVATHRKGDLPYFDKLHVAMGIPPKRRDLTSKEQSNARAIARHFFHFVLQQDTTNFHPESFPRTELRKELEAASTPVLHQFMRWFLAEYQRLGLDKVPPAQLFTNYKLLIPQLGQSATFNVVNTLSKQLGVDFAWFREHIHVGSKCKYFHAAKTQVAAFAKQLDERHQFETELLDGSLLEWQSHVDV